MRQGTAMMLLAAVLSTLAFSSCAAPQHNGMQYDKTLNERLLSIARSYLQRNHPDWVSETLELPSRITDKGDCWEVTFDLPKDTVGGTPVILVEKTTFRVIKAYHEQ
jgi:hypothetical protein